MLHRPNGCSDPTWDWKKKLNNRESLWVFLSLNKIGSGEGAPM